MHQSHHCSPCSCSCSPTASSLSRPDRLAHEGDHHVDAPSGLEAAERIRRDERGDALVNWVVLAVGLAAAAAAVVALSRRSGRWPDDGRLHLGLRPWHGPDQAQACGRARRRPHRGALCAHARPLGRRRSRAGRSRTRTRNLSQRRRRRTAPAPPRPVAQWESSGRAPSGRGRRHGGEAARHGSEVGDEVTVNVEARRRGSSRCRSISRPSKRAPASRSSATRQRRPHRETSLLRSLGPARPRSPR